MRISFIQTAVIYFFVAMGMVVGGSILGGVGALFMHSPPMSIMVRLADQIKIWALVSTLGGTMDTLRVIETGVLGLSVGPIVKQISYLSVAFIGAQIGFLLIRWLANVE